MWLAFLITLIIFIPSVALTEILTGQEVSQHIGNSFLWTFLWMYLTIQAWKLWKWKALFVYPAYRFATIIMMVLFAVSSTDDQSYGSILALYLIFGILLNIGGLVVFYRFIRKAEVTIRS